MKISARNQLSGKVASIKKGPVSTEVTVDIGGGRTIVSSITTTSAEKLGLAEGKEVQVIVKASNVMLGTD